MVKNVRIVCIREVEQFVESTNQGHDTSSQQSHPTIEQSSQQGQDRPSAPKRVRGPTKKKEICDLEDHQRILVTIDETGQPVGHEGSELTRFLGTLVRMPQHIGIQYLDWRKVPDNKKEDLWSLVKEKFAFEPRETKELKGWIMSDLSSKLKCWKYELKKKFDDQSLTLNEVVALLDDDRVDKDQFKQLAASWFTEEKQIEATKKKKNRLNSREPHVTGTKSFARLIHEEKKRNNGVRPSRGSMYRATRTRKDGSIVNSFAAEVVEKLKVVGESTDSTGETVDPLDWMNDDLSKVKGPESKGWVRCMGKVLTRKDKRLQDPQVPLLKAQVKNLHQGLMSFVAAVKLHILSHP